MAQRPWHREHLESVKLEGEEQGWELVVETDFAVYRFNAHGLASTDELESMLRKALDTINDWKAGA